MKNKIIIPAVVAVFAISGVSTIGYGYQAHALTPEQEEATHMATINGYLSILEKKIAQAPDLETANKYIAEYESGVQYSLAGLSASNQIVVRNSIELLKQKINILKANNAAQEAKTSNDNLRQEVRNEIAALKSSIQNTNNRIDQEKDGIIKYVAQEKDGILKHVAQEKDGIIKYIAQEKDGIIKYIAQEKNGIINYVKTEKDGIIKYVAQEKDGIIKYIAQEKDGILKHITQEKDGIIKYVAQEKDGIIKHIAQEKDGIINYVKVQRAEVEAQIKEAKTQFTAKINNLENKIAKLEAKNDSQDDEIKALKAELASLRNSVSELDNKLDSFKTELDGKIESLKTELGDKINNLESEVGNLKADFEDLDAEVENIWESIAEIWAEIDELLKKIKTESLEAEKRANEYTNSKIAELASRIENNLNERFGKVDKQIAKLNFKGLTAPNTGVERQNSNAFLALSSVILTLISSVVVVRKKF